METESDKGDEDEEEKEKEPEWHEFVPKEPSPILTGFYSEEGRFWVSMVSHGYKSLDMFLVVSIWTSSGENLSLGFTTHDREHSGSVVECLTQDRRPQVRASTASLRCGP